MVIRTITIVKHDLHFYLEFYDVLLAVLERRLYNKTERWRTREIRIPVLFYDYHNFMYDKDKKRLEKILNIVHQRTNIIDPRFDINEHYILAKDYVRALGSCIDVDGRNMKSWFNEMVRKYQDFDGVLTILVITVESALMLFKKESDESMNELLNYFHTSMQANGWNKDFCDAAEKESYPKPEPIVIPHVCNEDLAKQLEDARSKCESEKSEVDTKIKEQTGQSQKLQNDNKKVKKELKRCLTDVPEREKQIANLEGDKDSKRKETGESKKRHENCLEEQRTIKAERKKTEQEKDRIKGQCDALLVGEKLLKRSQRLHRLLGRCQALEHFFEESLNIEDNLSLGILIDAALRDGLLTEKDYKSVRRFADIRNYVVHTSVDGRLDDWHELNILWNDIRNFRPTYRFLEDRRDLD